MHPFIKKAIELEALKFGDFTLKSGLKSKYFFNARSFSDACYGCYLWRYRGRHWSRNQLFVYA